MIDCNLESGVLKLESIILVLPCCCTVNGCYQQRSNSMLHDLCSLIALLIIVVYVDHKSQLEYCLSTLNDILNAKINPTLINFNLHSTNNS
jgi:hypothetical protein